MWFLFSKQSSCLLPCLPAPLKRDLIENFSQVSNYLSDSPHPTLWRSLSGPTCPPASSPAVSFPAYLHPWKTPPTHPTRRCPEPPSCSWTNETDSSDTKTQSVIQRSHFMIRQILFHIFYIMPPLGTFYFISLHCILFHCTDLKILWRRRKEWSASIWSWCF